MEVNNYKFDPLLRAYNINVDKNMVHTDGWVHDPPMVRFFFFVSKYYDDVLYFLVYGRSCAFCTLCIIFYYKTIWWLTRWFMNMCRTTKSLSTQQCTSPVEDSQQNPNEWMQVL